MDMVGEGFLTTLRRSIQQGSVTLKQVETACRRILEAKYKLGLFGNPYLYIDESRPAREILTTATRKDAREIAARSFVLLKNTVLKNADPILPLRPSSTIALIGPLANDQRNMLGTWAVSGDWQQSVSVFSGIKKLLGDSSKII